MAEPNYVYDGNISKLEDEVARLNRRATKLNVPAIQLRIGESEKVFTCKDRTYSREATAGPAISPDPKAWGEGAPLTEHVRAEVSLTGDPPKLAGWTFVAVVDHLSNGLITRYPMGDQSFDLTPFRGADATCDHCQTKRLRHETFIVNNEEQGLTKRVGRTCLADFLGHHGNPASLIGHLNLWSKAFEALEGAESAGIGSGAPTLNLAGFVAHVAAEMRQSGWVSRGKVYAGHPGPATADVAQNCYWALGSPGLTEDERARMRPQPADEARAVKCIEWARKLTDSDVETNDYLYNLRAVCADDYIRPKRGGLAGSVIVAAERAFEKVAQAKSLATKSNLHIGSPKDRLTMDLTLVSLREVSGHYGVSILHRFEDSAGNALVWFASNPEIIPAPEHGHGEMREMNVGETLSLKFTVKGHDDFNGRNQTKVVRVVSPKKKAGKNA
jgi:hypothetical protein